MSFGVAAGPVWRPHRAEERKLAAEQEVEAMGSRFIETMVLSMEGSEKILGGS